MRQSNAYCVVLLVAVHTAVLAVARPLDAASIEQRDNTSQLVQTESTPYEESKAPVLTSDSEPFNVVAESVKPCSPTGFADLCGRMLPGHARSELIISAGQSIGHTLQLQHVRLQI
jgi:hypothetical protein